MQICCPKCSTRFETPQESDRDSLNCPRCQFDLSSLGATNAENDGDETFAPIDSPAATDEENDGDAQPDLTQTRDSSTQTVGHFTLVDRLGTGQFGNVYRARDNKLDREVAIKVPKEFIDANVREAFLREARAAAQLNHPNIVGIHEVDESEESVYLVSEFV